METAVQTDRPYYEVTFHGTLLVRHDNSRGTYEKTFDDITLKFPSLDVFREIHKYNEGFDYEKNQPIVREVEIYNFVGVVRRIYGPKFLTRHVPNFVRIRHMGVSLVQPKNGAAWDKISVRFLPWDLLEQYVREHSIPIDRSLYTNIDDMRGDIVAFGEDKEEFYSRIQLRKTQRVNEDMFEKMNAGGEVHLGDVKYGRGVSEVPQSETAPVTPATVPQPTIGRPDPVPTAAPAPQPAMPTAASPRPAPVKTSAAKPVVKAKSAGAKDAAASSTSDASDLF